MEITKSNHSEFFCKDFFEHGQILAIEISPFILSQDLMLISFEKKVLLVQLKIDEFVQACEILAEFEQVCQCTALTLSPATSIRILPNIITFAAASVDYNIRIFKSDLKGDDTCRILSGHNSYVNDAKFDPDNNFLVSVSDDNSAKLWETEKFKCVATLQLTSPGVSTCWHKEDNYKLLVAEKVGLIRFYNVETQSPILSLDYAKPLSSAHWAPSDSQLVASLQLGELLIWDLSKPCVPIHNNLIFTESGGQIRFSPFGELVAAVNNLDGTFKVVHVQNNQTKLSVAITLSSNISWHCRCPIVCLGSYTKLKFWSVIAK